MIEMMYLFVQVVVVEGEVEVVLVRPDYFELGQEQQLMALVKHYHFDQLVVYLLLSVVENHQEEMSVNLISMLLIQPIIEARENKNT
jgi:hypothetical protein